MISWKEDGQVFCAISNAVAFEKEIVISVVLGDPLQTTLLVNGIKSSMFTKSELVLALRVRLKLKVVVSSVYG